MVILAVLEDLLFRSKLEAAAVATGASLTVTRDVAAACRLLIHGAWQLVLLDLDGTADVAASIRQIRQTVPAVPLVGFCSHVDTARADEAMRAGCTLVLPRGAFVQRLPELLRGPLTTVSGTRTHAVTPAPPRR